MAAAHIISNEDLGGGLRLGWRDGILGEYFLNTLVLNQDLHDFEDWRGRLRFGCKVHL